MLYLTKVMVTINSTVSTKHVQDRNHLLSLGEGAHLNMQYYKLDLAEDWYLLILGAKISPEKRMRGFSSCSSLTAVRNLAAPPTGSTPLDSTL